MTSAFGSLPERWRMVLWHTEVEGERPAALAPILGMSPGAVAALSFRAREGLREAFLAMHVSDQEPACRETLDQLGSYVRGGASKRVARGPAPATGPATGPTPRPTTPVATPTPTGPAPTPTPTPTMTPTAMPSPTPSERPTETPGPTPTVSTTPPAVVRDTQGSAGTLSRVGDGSWQVTITVSLPHSSAAVVRATGLQSLASASACILQRDGGVAPRTRTPPRSPWS